MKIALFFHGPELSRSLHHVARLPSSAGACIDRKVGALAQLDQARHRLDSHRGHLELGPRNGS